MHDDAQKVAVQWFIKLRSADVTSADRHSHREWLLSGDKHQSTYDDICKEWSDLDGIDDWARGELGQLNLAQNTRIGRKVAPWVVSFAVAATLVLGFVLWPVLDGETQHFQTVKSERRLVTLGDGSQLHLNTASAVEVSFENELREVTLSKGEGVFDVQHDSLRPFVVHAGGSSVIALGTRFSVEFRSLNELEVTVLEGRVAIVPRQESASNVIEKYVGEDRKIPEESVSLSKHLILGPDQQAIVGIEGKIDKVQEVNAANETAWLEGKLVFDGAPLREVVRELSRYVPGQIHVAKEVPDHPVTGIVQIRSTEAMLDLLSQVVPVTPVKQSSSVTVLHAVPMRQPGG
jgi:transmembrane sensor